MPPLQAVISSPKLLQDDTQTSKLYSFEPPQGATLCPCISNNDIRIASPSHHRSQDPKGSQRPTQSPVPPLLIKAARLLLSGQSPK